MVLNTYQPSHLGKIPDDWKRVKFSTITKVRQGLQIAISERLTTPTETSKEYITIQSIKKTDQVREYVEMPSDRVTCRKDDVLMTRTGNTGIVVTDVEGAFHNNFFLMDYDRNKINKKFLIDYLRTNRVQHLILTKAGASTIPDLNHKDFYSIEFPLAPLEEQRKIALILSAWDKAISTTESLIANSQQQKKSLMQQLLTGKKRFAEFEGEWEEVPLKSLGKCITGLTYSPNDITDEGILVLRSSNIQNGKLSFIDNVYVSKTVVDENKTQNGDILVCVRNGSKNLIGKSALINKKCSGETHGAFMTLFRSKYPDYTFQLFQTREYYRQVHQNLGATINSINTSNLYKFKFVIPTNINELKKVASVLSSAYQEINILQQKLTHLKQEKKALMQQLLTGKRRVIVDNETEAA